MKETKSIINDCQPVVVGIDPDCDKSGIAVYDKSIKKLVSMDCFTLIDLMLKIKLYNELFSLTVHLEAGWLKCGTWHKGGNGMAKRVGANHQIGKEIEKFLIRDGITYKLIEPQGYSSYTHEYFCRLTGWDNKIKTNSETRVAGMMCYGY